MNDEELRLKLSLADELSGPFKKVLGLIGSAADKVGKANNDFRKLETTMASAGAKAGLFGGKIASSATNITTATAGLKAYQAQVDRLSKKMGTNPQVLGGLAGNFKGAGGKIVGADDARAYNTANSWVKTLNGNTAMLAQTQKGLFKRDLQRGADEYSAKVRHAASFTGKLEQRFNGIAQVSPSVRYALYDVSRTMAVAGAAMVAGGVAAGAMAVSFERSFANVQRVTDLGTIGTANLRAEFIKLAQELPSTFAELTSIGQLGAQLGIDTPGMAKFTETVVQLTTTTNLSAEAAGTALGRFKALGIAGEDQFTNLASSILGVGRTSVATETQIVGIATQIASMGKFAGFTGDEVIGLSGALASVGAPAELSRGLITRVFTNMSKAVAGGGRKLENFARVSGITADQFASTWGTPAFADTFVKFMAGINDSGGDAVATLNELGITSVRDVPLLLRLANATSTVGVQGALLAENMGNAKDFWEANTETAVQYAKVSQTVAERLKVLVSNFQVLLDAIGSNAIPLFNLLIDASIGIAQALTNIANNPVGGWVVAIIVGITALVGVMLLLGAGAARGYAALIAVGNALGATTLQANGATVSFSALTASMVAQGGAAKAAVFALKGLAFALKAASLAGIALIGFEVGSWSRNMIDDIKGVTVSTTDMNKALAAGGNELGDNLMKGIDTALVNTGSSMEQFAEIAVKTRNNLGDLFDLAADTNLDQGDLGGKIKNLDAVMVQLVQNGAPEEAARQFAFFAAANKKAGFETSNLNKLFPQYVAGQAEAAAATKGGTEAAEQEAAALELVYQAAEKLREALAKASTDFVTNTDLIAKNVDRQKAAAEAQADLANKGKKAADTSRVSWEKFYDGQKINLQDYLKDLQSASDAQLKWQENLSSLIGKIPADLINDLALMGPEGAALTAALTTATKPELEKFVALWDKSGAEAGIQFAASLMAQEDALGRAADALGKRGGDVTRARFLAEVAAGRMPFVQVLKKYGLDAMGNPIPITANTEPAKKGVRDFVVQTNRTGAHIWIIPRLDGAAVAGIRSTLGSLTRVAGSPGFAHGGYTGSGAKYEAAGVVHKGEFVMTKEATSRIGLDNLYAMMRGQRGARGYASGGAVGGGNGGGGPMFASLDAGSLQAIMAMGNRPIYLYTTDRKLAESVSRGNTELAYRGTN